MRQKTINRTNLLNNLPCEFQLTTRRNVSGDGDDGYYDCGEGAEA